jgi:proteasome lid subunit RPN8/RPN11
VKQAIAKDGTVQHVILPELLQQEIYTQLEASYPNEGGGFLLGHVEGEGAQVIIRRVQPVVNTFASEEQYHRYAMTPADWARLEDAAEEQGLTLVGYYHSHPDTPAVPSEFDRAHALPNFRYLITSVRQGKASELRAWLLADDRSRFDELTVSVTGQVPAEG